MKIYPKKEVRKTGYFTATSLGRLISSGVGGGRSLGGRERDARNTIQAK